MEDYEVMHSKKIHVNVKGTSHLVVEADLSIVCSDGKYGLVRSTKDPADHSYFTELILNCEYDNLFFVEFDYFHHLIAVSEGKQGLFTFECQSAESEDVAVRQILPCIYDRIEIGRKTKLLFLHKGSEVSCFHRESRSIFTKCESYIELSKDYLFCISNSSNELWHTCRPRFVFAADTLLISHLGIYEQSFFETGDVFALRYWRDELEGYEEQLLFCESLGENFHLGPMAKNISVHTKFAKEQIGLTKIEMCFGNGKDILTCEDVNAITKEVHSFELI